MATESPTEGGGERNRPLLPRPSALRALTPVLKTSWSWLGSARGGGETFPVCCLEVSIDKKKWNSDSNRQPTRSSVGQLAH